MSHIVVGQPVLYPSQGRLPTKPTEPDFVGFVGNPAGLLSKIELVEATFSARHSVSMDGHLFSGHFVANDDFVFSQNCERIIHGVLGVQSRPVLWRTSRTVNGSGNFR